MSKENLYTKKKLDSKNINITAVNISGRNIITGDDKGNLTIYEIKKKSINYYQRAKIKFQNRKNMYTKSE